MRLRSCLENVVISMTSLNAVIAVTLKPWMASNFLILRAGDGDRTRDVQLGKLAFYR
jgi:hypothetical protein